MVKDKEAIKKALDRWLTHMAREQHCKDDEIAIVAYDHLRDTRYF